VSSAPTKNEQWSEQLRSLLHAEDPRALVDLTIELALVLKELRDNGLLKPGAKMSNRRTMTVRRAYRLLTTLSDRRNADENPRTEAPIEDAD
jgi:hypothetical protein